MLLQQVLRWQQIYEEAQLKTEETPSSTAQPQPSALESWANKGQVVQATDF